MGRAPLVRRVVADLRGRGLDALVSALDNKGSGPQERGFGLGAGSP